MPKPIDELRAQFIEIINSNNKLLIEEFINELKAEYRHYHIASDERESISDWIIQLEKSRDLANITNQQDHLDNVNQFIEERDWNSALKEIGNYLKKPEASFNQAYKIFQIMSNKPDIGFEKLLSFLRHNVPSIHHGEEKYKLLLDVLEKRSKGNNKSDDDIFTADLTLEDPVGPESSETIAKPSIHTEKARQLMEDADEFLYNWDFKQAIRLYDQVLFLEPDYERAKDNLLRSQDYLDGDIPPRKLPRAAAISFGKAQSALKAGQYPEAERLLQRAYQVLEESNITQWNEGDQLQEQIFNCLAAEDRYKDAVELFNVGDFLEAKRAIDDAFETNQVRIYDEFRKTIGKVEGDLTSIQKQLNITNVPVDIQIDMMLDAQAKINELEQKFPQNTAVQNAKKRLTELMPLLKNQLKRRAENLLDQIQDESSHSNIDHARTLCKRAHEAADAAEKAGAIGEEFEELKISIEKTQRELDGLSKLLQEARSNFDDNASWFWNRWQKTYESLVPVIRQYPRDSEVQKLRIELRWRNYIINLMQIIGGLIILIIMGAICWQSYRKINGYIEALTPSPTITTTNTPLPTNTNTPTSTSTPTPTYTVTPTSTSTETPTPTPTPTNTPIIYVTTRDIYARNGCYDGFNQTGKLHRGSLIVYDSDATTSDNHDRTCLFVRYLDNETGKTVSGYVLLQDLEPLK